MPAARSDAVAEASLGALATLLGRVAPANGEQLTGLLQRLLPIASLPRTAAAEEVSTQQRRMLGKRWHAPSMVGAHTVFLTAETTAPCKSIDLFS